MKILLDALRNELKPFNARQVSKFIIEVIGALDAQDAFTKYSDESQRKHLLLAAKKATELFLRDAFTPIVGQAWPRRMNAKHSFTLVSPSAEALSFYHAQKAGKEAAEAYLAAIERTTGSITARSGRPQADKYGMFGRIAHSYLDCLDERPTSTPGGHFANIVSLLLRYQSPTQQLPRDVSRQVRAAIKAM